MRLTCDPRYTAVIAEPSGKLTFSNTDGSAQVAITGYPHKNKHVHGGKKWFYKTLDDLAEVSPYIKRSSASAEYFGLIGVKRGHRQTDRACVKIHPGPLGLGGPVFEEIYPMQVDAAFAGTGRGVDKRSFCRD